jgi:hypothetical protein
MDIQRLRHNIQDRFRHNRAITDIHLIDILRCKGEMELQECMLGFKTKTHVIRALDPSRDLVAHGPESYIASHSLKQSQFLNDFFAGSGAFVHESGH